MQFTNQQKALGIALGIGIIMLITAFNVGLRNHFNGIAESYFEIEPEPPVEELPQPMVKDLNVSNTSSKTNKAYNETEALKPFAQAYKHIAPPKDYIATAEESETTSIPEHNLPSDDQSNQEAYKQIDRLLKNQETQNSSINSSMSYALKGRRHISIPTPVYLCETGGTIVINITVNAKGNVTYTQVNTVLSTSNNECLIDYALNYANQAQFNAAENIPSQIGTITFHFKNK